MNAKSDSKNNTAYFIRLGILLFIMLAAGGAFAYDRLVLVPGGKKAVENVVAACDSNGDRAAVLKAAGREPTATEKIGSYQIDDWSYPRIMPHLPGYRVSVVFLNDQVSEVYNGGITAAERAEFRQ